MLAKVYSAAVYGVDAYEVEIEVNAAKGAPVTVIVGLPDIAVKESRDRVLTAVHNSGYRSPQGRTTINLAPADVKKEGPSFDLPIALGTIAVGEEIRLPDLDQYAFVGELALDGAVRGVNGVLPIALEARKKGRRAIMDAVRKGHAAYQYVRGGVEEVTGQPADTTRGIRKIDAAEEFPAPNRERSCVRVE